MSAIRRFVKRIAYALSSKRQADDLRAELEAHRACIQAHLESDGLPAGEAAARSRRAMGNVMLAREDARDVWLGTTPHRLWRDAGYALRALRREPTFALTALLALTIGIATTTTAFSVADAELWRPLPFPEARQLVAARATRSGRYDALTARDLDAWRARSRTARYVGITATSRRVLRRRDRSESVTTLGISSDFLDVLGVRPSIGRGFPAQVQDTAILSDAGWIRLFDRDPTALGHVVLLDDQPYTIVGITAGARFEFMTEPDFFVAYGPAQESAPADRPSRRLDIYARLGAGVTIGEAQAELRTLGTTDEVRGTGTAGDARVLTLMDLQEETTGSNWRTLYFFLGAAAILLVLSGLNAASLLLARALRRQREFAIRGALGGGLAALVRQLTVEGAVLAIPASVVGLLVSTWLLHILTMYVPPGQLERGGHITLDLRAAGFVLGICGLATIGLALTPMVFARRIDLNVTLGQGHRSVGPARRDRRIRSMLLTAQVTATVVLLTAAALFTASFYRVAHAPLGFDPNGRIAARLALSGPRYVTDGAVLDFTGRVVADARAAGIREVAVGNSTPLDSRGAPGIWFAVNGRPRPEHGQEPTAVLRSVGPDFFRALGVRVVAGREFTAADAPGGPAVAIVNELLVQRFFQGENPIGRELELIAKVRSGWANRSGAIVIVGVVSDVRNFGINEVAFNNIYLPFAQAPSSGFEIVASSPGPADGVMASIRALLARADASQPIVLAETLRDRLDGVTRGDRFNMVIVLFFAAAATLLAAVGIYGAMACSVQERTREFGVRMALGARASTVMRAALSSSLRIAVVGGVAGLSVAYVIARLLGNALYLVPGAHGGLLYEVRSTDPLILGPAALLVVCIAIAAAFMPARQAARIDPLAALRSE